MTPTKRRGHRFGEERAGGGWATGRARRRTWATTFPVLVALVLALLAPVTPARGDASAQNDGNDKNWSTCPANRGTAACTTKITMRDGTTLWAGAYLPDDVYSGSEVVRPAAVLISITPYGDTDVPERNPQYPAPGDAAFNSHPEVRALSKEGQQPVFVRVHVRGTGASSGTFCALCEQEQQDVAEIVAWAASRPWSNGRVGLVGRSYAGITALLGAAQQLPDVKVVVADHVYADPYRDAVRQNGMLNTTFTSLWSAVQVATSARGGVDRLVSTIDGTAQTGGVPGTPPTVQALSERFDGDFYRERAIYPRWKDITVPTLLLGGWRDGFSRGTVWNFRGIASEHKKLFMNPFGHQWGGVRAEPNTPYADQRHIAERASWTTQLQWLNRFLLDDPNGVEDQPAVEYFDMGSREWRSAETWPPATQLETFRMRAGSALRSEGVAPDVVDDGWLDANPAGRREQPDAMRFAYDPSVGTTDALGKWGEISLTPQVSLDQRPDEARSLTYSTPPLSEPLPIAGPMELKLAAATTAPDVDWVVKISDVDPSGKAVLMTSGYLRASHRAVDDERSHPAEPWIANDTPSEVIPDRPHRYRIDLWPTAWTVKPGHRLRMAISSADTPTHAPSPHPAINTVFHDGRGSLASELIVTTARTP